MWEAKKTDSWRRSIEALYMEEEKSLYNVVYRWVWNEQDAIDIVQESFLFLWKRRPEIDPDKYRPYLYRTGLILLQIG